MPENVNVPQETVEDEVLTPLNVREMQASWVFDKDGEAVGKIADVLVNAEGNPEWVLLSYGAFLRHDVLLPTYGMTPHEQGFVTPYNKDHIHEGPKVGIANMSDDDERELMGYWCGDRPGAESPRACTYSAA